MRLSQRTGGQEERQERCLCSGSPVCPSEIVCADGVAMATGAGSPDELRLLGEVAPGEGSPAQQQGTGSGGVRCSTQGLVGYLGRLPGGGDPTPALIYGSEVNRQRCEVGTPNE